MNYYQLLADCFYLGCITPLAFIGTRLLITWSWAFIKRWGSAA